MRTNKWFGMLQSRFKDCKYPNEHDASDSGWRSEIIHSKIETKPLLRYVINKEMKTFDENK